MTASGAPAITVSHLRVERGGRPILPDVSLTIPRGEITGLLGPSGSGKSTLIRAIVGVQRVHGGAVDVLGRPAGSAELRPRVGYVTQAPSVYADLTVTENLRYFAAILRAPPTRVAEVLDAVGMSARASQPVRTLSGGERARASLATAMLNEPEVLVLDEPTVGLDPVLRRDLWRRFRELASAGTTLLVSSHVMDEAAECDRLLLLREGAILAEGSPADLLAATGAPDLERAFLELIERGSAEAAAAAGASR
jgi:ABC-2 type transport system ATP-binding protein